MFFDSYYIMKLSEDMVSIAETPKHVIVNNPYGACGDGVTDDKPFIHKNDGWYYLSWGCFYGMSKSVYVGMHVRSRPLSFFMRTQAVLTV